MGQVKSQIPYADGKTLKDLFDSAWLAKGLPEKPVAVGGEKKAPKKKEAAEAQGE